MAEISPTKGHRRNRFPVHVKKGSGVSMPRRDLTAAEAAVLRMIQEGYGAQNRADEVFFTGRNEAAIFVKASDGTSPLMANLTNLAAWRADGTIASDDDLRSEWLRV
jgi:hypothetical protein